MTRVYFFSDKTFEFFSKSLVKWKGWRAWPHYRSRLIHFCSSEIMTLAKSVFFLWSGIMKNASRSLSADSRRRAITKMNTLFLFGIWDNIRWSEEGICHIQTIWSQTMKVLMHLKVLCIVLSLLTYWSRSMLEPFELSRQDWLIDKPFDFGVWISRIENYRIHLEYFRVACFCMICLEFSNFLNNDFFHYLLSIGCPKRG